MSMVGRNLQSSSQGWEPANVAVDAKSRSSMSLVRPDLQCSSPKWASANTAVAETPCPWSNTICDLAFMGSHYYVLGWALVHGCPNAAANCEWYELNVEQAMCICTQLMFLLCVAHNSARPVSQSNNFARNCHRLPYEVVQHIAMLI